MVHLLLADLSEHLLLFLLNQLLSRCLCLAQLELFLGINLLEINLNERKKKGKKPLLILVLKFSQKPIPILGK